MKKKNKKIIIIILVIVLIISITLFLLFGFKKFNSTVDNDKLEEKEEEIVSSKLTDEEVNTLLDKIKIYDNYFITLVGNKKPIDMTDDEKFLFYMKNNYQKFNKGVSSKEIESYLKEYFGNSITYTPITTYLCPIDNLPLIIYDKATDLYKADYSNHGHDGDAISRIYSYYIDGSKETNSKTTYKIRVRKAFSNYVTVGLTTRFYGNYNDAINNRNEIFDLYKIYGDENMDNEELAKRVKTQYEKYKGMFNIYTYTFETDNNIENSYLVSLTK
mgnify:FL=1